MRFPQRFPLVFSWIGSRRRFLVAMLVLLAAGKCLFAGQEFLAGPGEQTVADQLIVRLQLGADINQIVASLLPQAVASLVSSHGNTSLRRRPRGTQAPASKLLAAHPLVQYVEPTRIRHTTVVPPNDPKITQQWALTTLRAVRSEEHTSELQSLRHLVCR